MTQPYTDADVQAAVKATRRVKGGTIVGLLVEKEVRLALDAVAPAIAARAKAEALREFADMFMGETPGLLLDAATCRDLDLLARNRASEIERGT